MRCRVIGRDRSTRWPIRTIWPTPIRRWAGGDALRIQQLARAVTPPIARPVLGLLALVPGPVAAALRTGLDTLIDLAPKVSPA